MAPRVEIVPCRRWLTSECSFSVLSPDARDASAMIPKVLSRDTPYSRTPSARAPSRSTCPLGFAAIELTTTHAGASADGGGIQRPPPSWQGAKPRCHEMTIKRERVRNSAFGHHREAHRIRKREILAVIRLQPVGYRLGVQVGRVVHDEIGRPPDVAHEG